MAYFRSGFVTLIFESLYKKRLGENSKMTHFVEANPEERALIPNVMQPSPSNSIKRE